VVSKRLVELMDGIIGVESTVGKGTIFWVDLISTSPLVLPPLASGNTVAATALPAGVPVRTLLYVEDNPANLKLVERLIARRPDLRLLSAIDGNTGVDLARSFLPDVILMDINLPGISGIEALQILQNDSVTSHIPVVALSANAIPRDIQKGLEAGFFRYLTKPIKVAEFLETLNLALEVAAERHAGNA
jgi:CheY-like chemotaxis protein